MSLSAWITSIAVGIVLYGGLAWCIMTAVRKEREKRDEISHGGADQQ
ncbi:MAG: hypothetical protein KAW67_04405 [Candidatus Eisenbacteria sp.]|nr:hypothetical protein [Candidatus Eisenbacteria bacterium]